MGAEEAEDERADAPILSNVAVSLSPEWFLLRALRITASVFAVICGLSVYCTPWSLWDKMMNDPFYQMEGNEACWHGQLHEPDCIRGFEAWSGNSVIECPYRTDERYAWIGATPDGLVLDDVLRPGQGPAILECKCPYYHMYDSPPIQYVLQTYVQMFVYHVPVAYLSAWHPSGRMRIWRVHWNEACWAWCMLRARAFWYCMQEGVRPTPEMIPMVVHPTQQWLLQGEDQRWNLAATYGVKPWMLPPAFPIETLLFDLIDDHGPCGKHEVRSAF
jgi:putative phage-type endonuclease